MLQLQHTPPPQSTTPGLHPVSIHQMAPSVRGSKHPITAYYSVYRPQKDERLSRPGWLVTYRNKVLPPGVEPGHVTHPSTNRARRRVTSLIRPTSLPWRHAANVNILVLHWLSSASSVMAVVVYEEKMSPGHWLGSLPCCCHYVDTLACLTGKTSCTHPNSSKWRKNPVSPGKWKLTHDRMW